jgi:hypothetical protein
MKVYIGQYGMVWSLTPEQWKLVLESGASGAGYDLGEVGARQLRRFPRGICKSKGDPGSCHRGSEFMVWSPLLEFHEPLDWEPEAFQEQLALITTGNNKVTQ